MNPTQFQSMLAIIEQWTVLARLLAPLTGPIAGDVAEGAQIAGLVEGIVGAAAQVHQEALGAPMDLSKLHQIMPAN